MNLRNQARGRDCQIRSCVCTFDKEQTVLAHYRSSGISGIGIKSPDILGSWACYACHQLVDTGRYGEFQLERDERDLMLLQGMARTIATLVKEGKIKS